MTDAAHAASSLAGARCLVTGAAGFVGRNLVDALAARGCTVVAFDLAPVAERERVVAVRGDVTRRDDVDRAMRGVDVVFHTAARIATAEWAPRGAREAVHAVNVEGTRNLVESAIAAGATRLVHTSSASVCFGPTSAGGDESLAYSRYEDMYTTTKVAAERLVRDADGRGALRTGAVRPGGIYGPGERNQLLGAVLGARNAGQPITVIGDGRSRLDYTFIDNLVDAELRLAERLVEGSPACGRAYFVSDDEPINHGEWSRRLLSRMGLDASQRHLPVGLATAISLAMELAWRTFGKPEPLLTRMHVRTCAHDAWYAIGAARRDLGYAPLVDTDQGISRTVDDALAYWKTLAG